MSIEHLNHTLYTDLPIDEMDYRLEKLESRLALDCWLVSAPYCRCYASRSYEPPPCLVY